jgi:hypothetical protein
MTRINKRVEFRSWSYRSTEEYKEYMEYDEEENESGACPSDL